ncbi:hypothetical protein [Thermococcus sp.]|uniref:hypothetical protein n=1 Tax=Thermococcus sp. TaxID=35749 RepID=UPI0026179042|nr:hypothetical protein [Thermococcus sp.]
MDIITIIASVIFAGFFVRTLYLLLREGSQKELLLTTGLWALALLVWALYLWSEKGPKASITAVILLSVVTFALSFYGLLRLKEERPEEFEKEL